MLEAAATELSVFDGARWLKTTHWTANVRTIKITNMVVLASFIVLTPGSVLPTAPGEIARRGKSATRRAAIVP